MHITAYCPECQSRYQLNADLRGQRMRCPNAGCHAVFVVQEATGGSPRGASNGPRATDARGELVPLAGDRSRHAAPIEELDWRAAPPPVQGAVPIAKPAPPAPVKPAPKRIREWDQTPAPNRRRRNLVLVLALAGVVLAVGGYGIHYVLSAVALSEEALRTDAAKSYADRSFANAAKKYHALAEKHGRGEYAAEYRFLADLSDLQDAAAPPVSDPSAALAKAEAFAKQYDTRDPQLKDKPERRKALTDALAAIVTGFAEAANSAATDLAERSAPAPLDPAQTGLDLLARYGGNTAELRGRLDAAGAALVKATQRRSAIHEVRKMLEGPRPNVAEARQRARRLGVLDAVREEIERAENEGGRSVAYEALNRPPQPIGPAVGPSCILLETAPTVNRPPTEVVLAAARGLLYALDAHDGRRLWVCRVGLDAGELPARLPIAGDEPELILVAATDPPALAARNVVTGAVVWHQPLDAPCLGRPVRDDAGRIFVPTAGPEGLVYDLDARTGVVHGRFVTRQPLAGGGAFDGATRRLYVPAHGQGVFVFSYGAEGPKCEGLLRTNHPAGSLRGEPIVVTGPEGLEVSRYLVLGQADGLGAMSLRAFRLFTAATESPIQAEVRLPGWSWFPPFHDPETIALVTDAGAIGLFGIQQAGDADPPLFPLLGETVSAAAGNPKPARAQLVHAEEAGFWVLADGVLRHWRLGLSRQAGRQLVPAWGDGVRLGAPLHAAQVSADRQTLFVVTQANSPPADRATAVNAATGEIVWQRPLGLAVQGDPVALGGAVIVLDQSGGLYRFDPGQHPLDAKEPSQTGGREIAKPVPELIGAPYLISTADGQSAWEVLVCADDGAFTLNLRHVATDGSVTSGSVAVSAPLAGTPALGPTALILPLANGQLCRVTLDAAPRLTPGPTWRALGARPDVRGHVVHWKGDEFLVSDGGRRLARVMWPGGNSDQRPMELSQRLIGPFARLPGGGVAVADAGGTVTLLGGDRLTVARAWQIGPVTAGPWVVGDKLAVVVDRRRLVWLNPETDQPVWIFVTTGDGIESPPRLVDGRLVVADLAGRFVGLDPATGKAIGGGYQFPAEAAPASAVVEFGPGRLFAPLTDGTVLLLPIAELER